MAITVSAPGARRGGGAGGAPARAPDGCGAASPSPTVWSGRLGAALAITYPVVLVAVTVAGVALRFASPRNLWLDEALSVDISRLPPRQLLAALKVDGSPPLYYLVLHGWIAVFGAGTHAVRALSGVVSAAALVPMWFLGRRVGGRQLAVYATALLAAAPFALRFGSETRMYSLVLLETCLAGVALLRALERESVPRLGVLAISVVALALTHYWTFFLIAAAAVGLIAGRRWRVFAALVVAGVLFSPQIPTLLYQLRHTGTPWAPPTRPRAVIDTLLAWGGPPGYGWAAPLGLVLIGLAAVGALTHREGGAGRLLVGFRGARPGPALLGLAVGPLVIAVAATMAAGAGFVERYTAIAIPAYLLLVGLGLARLEPRAGRGLLVVAAVGGLITGSSDALHSRTQAGQVATALTALTGAGDVIVYCPDQLAPAVHRLLPPGRVERSYGDELGPTRIDWVDYTRRNAGLDPTVLAERYDALAGPGHSVALVWAEGYRTLEGQCGTLAGALAQLRPAATGLVARDPGQGESAAVELFPGTNGLPPQTLSNPSAALRD